MYKRQFTPGGNREALMTVRRQEQGTMALARRLMLALALVVLAAGSASAQIESTVHNLTATSAKMHGDTRCV